MSASNYLAKKIVELMKGQTITGPAKFFIAFCENEITKTMTGTTISEAGVGAELTYEGYARVELSLTEVEIIEGGGAAADKALNKLAVALKLNTNTTGKSLAKWFAICDAATAGNVWFFGKLAEELNIVKAITKLEVPAKSLEITAE